MARDVVHAGPVSRVPMADGRWGLDAPASDETDLAVAAAEVWGVRFAGLTRAGAVEAVRRLIEARRPSYFITANTHYVMLSNRVEQLSRVNDRAAFILADGAPVVWGSKLAGRPLPERVAGSDLIYDLSEQAARLGHRLFLLGGAEGVAEAAARRLEELYPGLVVAGTACPPHRELHHEEHEALTNQIREARPDLLFVAFGQPKGELWIERNLESIRVPVSVQVGASLDFVAGRVRRAPTWIQRIGMEWSYRLWLEPGRLGPRYTRNGLFLASAVAGDMARRTASAWRGLSSRPRRRGAPRGGGRP